ncbi:MAG: hypothetical protein HY731_09405 [Candidatus Tectomicrobia bacterium]|nr:hypothetical protein [Candidatus Tectomicrobia bacterium]
MIERKTVKVMTPYTALIRRSVNEYVAICLELNVSARGADLPEVEKNLKHAAEDYLEYAKETALEIEPISIKELTEFLRDTSIAEPERKRKKRYFHTLELHEVPLYV